MTGSQRVRRALPSRSRKCRSVRSDVVGKLISTSGPRTRTTSGRGCGRTAGMRPHPAVLEPDLNLMVAELKPRGHLARG